MLDVIFIIVISILTSKFVAKNFESIYVNNIHIHHWMWGLIGLIISFIYKYKYTSAVLLGIILEGLSYNDRFVL
jgi:hypothetical protein